MNLYRVIDDAYGMDGEYITARQLRKILVVFYHIHPDLVEDIVEERYDGLYECDELIAIPSFGRAHAHAER